MKNIFYNDGVTYSGYTKININETYNIIHLRLVSVTNNMQCSLPKTTMYDDDILHYVDSLHIPHFKGVKMRDELVTPWDKECGVLNLEPHMEEGSHWMAWFKDGKERYVTFW